MPVIFAIAAAISVGLSVLSATDDHPDSRYYAAFCASMAVICFCFFTASVVLSVIRHVNEEAAPTQDQKPVANERS